MNKLLETSQKNNMHNVTSSTLDSYSQYKLIKVFQHYCDVYRQAVQGRDLNALCIAQVSLCQALEFQLCIRGTVKLRTEWQFLKKETLEVIYKKY